MFLTPSLPFMQTHSPTRSTEPPRVCSSTFPNLASHRIASHPLMHMLSAAGSKWYIGMQQGEVKTCPCSVRESLRIRSHWSGILCGCMPWRENTCLQIWPCGWYCTAAYGCRMVMTLRADILSPGVWGTSLLDTVLDGPALSIMLLSPPICDPALCGLQLFLRSSGASRKCLRFIQASTFVVVSTLDI